MTVERLRRLSKYGMDRFREALSAIRQGRTDTLPPELLNDGNLTEVIEKPAVSISDCKFSSKKSFAVYITSLIDFKNYPDLLWDEGMWSWLSVFYWKQVCPPGTKPSEDDHYILLKSSRTYYRHHLASSVLLYHTAGSAADLLLSGTLSTLGDIMEQIAGRQELATAIGILEATKILYWDNGRQAPKSGITGKHTPGGLRRFMTVLRQFDRTYDLHSMSGEEIIQLLPDEFKLWIQEGGSA